MGGGSGRKGMDYKEVGEKRVFGRICGIEERMAENWEKLREKLRNWKRRNEIG